MIEVFSEGALNRRILFIGEAPGEYELQLSRPFVGRAGKEQDHLNLLSGIQRDDARWTNVVRERCPADDISHFINLGKKPDYPSFLSWIRGETEQVPPGINPEVRRYVRDLFKEVENFHGNVVVPLGNVPLWVLTGQAQITKRRGSILSAHSRKIVPCVHPSAVLRSGSLIERRLALLDLQRVKEESFDPKIKLPQRELLIYPRFEEAIAYIDECSRLSEIGFDIECMKTADGGIEMSCFALATSSHRSMSIPLFSKGKNAWTELDEVELFSKLAELLENPRVTKVGQNIIFDSSFMHRKHGILCHPVEDTMIAQAIRFPDLPKGLDFLCRYYTREPYYKDEGKEWGTVLESREADFFRYNAKDACIVLEILPKIMASIKQQDER